MTDRKKLSEKLMEIACRCNKTNYSYNKCDLNEIENGVRALYDAANLLEKGLGRPTDEGWPMNLLLDIGIVCTVIESEEIEENLMYAMESLKERDRQILILRYKDGKTYEEISEYIGVCKQKSQDLTHRILRNLSRPERLDVICNGRESINSYLKHKDDFVSSLSQLKTDIRAIRNHIEDKEPLPEDFKPREKSIYEMPVPYLGLSEKLQNSLKRAGVKKIKDLDNLTREELLHTRNLGPKSADEIIEKAKEYGFKIV